MTFFRKATSLEDQVKEAMKTDTLPETIMNKTIEAMKNVPLKGGQNCFSLPNAVVRGVVQGNGRTMHVAEYGGHLAFSDSRARNIF